MPPQFKKMGPWRLLTFFFCYTRKKEKRAPTLLSLAPPPPIPPVRFLNSFIGLFFFFFFFLMTDVQDSGPSADNYNMPGFYFSSSSFGSFSVSCPLKLSSSRQLFLTSSAPPQANGIRTRRRRRRENGGQKARLVTRSHSLVGSGD